MGNWSIMTQLICENIKIYLTKQQLLKKSYLIYMKCISLITTTHPTGGTLDIPLNTFILNNKVPRGQKAKQVVLEHLLKTEPAFKIEYTRYGNPKPESYDRADAIIVAKAGNVKENN